MLTRAVVRDAHGRDCPALHNAGRNRHDIPLVGLRMPNTGVIGGLRRNATAEIAKRLEGWPG